MATTTVPLTNPLFLKDVSLIVGPSGGTTYEFKAALESVLFTPQTTTDTFSGIGGTTVSDVSIDSWTCTVGYIQDWETSTSLSNYLQSNPGLTTDAVFKPKTAGAKSVTATITLVPGPIGGPKGKAMASVTFGVQGTPTVA
ncbi:hypothetical protein [Cellulomonas composti]|uniref:Uncharacterized protein n=1 Tax=Cellulomonas composti TaxID=266130 RepID=A0A511JBJ3_9CELL|nr:hypothetical protein [Cellulomonas composti]GEL95357.1 hypothetical protein CCO02nite_20150 [Cellulomonas composti]